MDFYDLLKEAARNKKKAENELQENKRFSLNFRPKKLPPKPKVDRAAIAARLKRKEEEEKRRAAIEEKKRQEVLALRAEQEAAKSAARKRKSSSSSSHQPSTSSREKSREPRKKAPLEDESQSDEEPQVKKEKPLKAKKEKVVAPKKEKYADYLFKKRHEEEDAKSRKAKAMLDPKGKSFSFKELMNIAAANAGVATPGAADQNVRDEKCQPNVKLKNGDIALEKQRSDDRIPRSRDSESASSDEKRKGSDRKMGSRDKLVNRKPILTEEVTSKRNEVSSSGGQKRKKKPDSSYNGLHPKNNTQVYRETTVKNHSTPRPPKSTCFPNTKALNNQSDSENTPRAKSPHDRGRSDSKDRQRNGMTGGPRQNYPKRSSDGESRLKERAKMEQSGRGVKNGMTGGSCQNNPKRSSDGESRLKESSKIEKQSGRGVENGMTGGSRQNIPKRSSDGESRLKESSKIEKQFGRGVENGMTGGSRQNNAKRSSDGESRLKERAKMEKQSGRSVENGTSSHHPVKRKGGWSEPNGEIKRKPETTGEGRDGRPMPHPAKREGGWLDPVGGPARNTDSAGKRNNNSSAEHHPVKRKGGWLDPVNSPAPDRDRDRQVNGTGRKIIRASEGKIVLSEAENDRPKLKQSGRLDLFERRPVVTDKEALPHKGKQLVSRESSSSPVTKARPESLKASRGETTAKPKKRGWLDDDVRPPPAGGGGGWLGPARKPASRPGGWLGQAREPSWQAKGGRLLSSDEEEEDSDLDGFIDDEPIDDEPANVSSYIKEIFGYDKSSFGDENLSDYALSKSMESSYSQMMKEEAKSARIAAREDAEELRKEKEREKKKLAAKRR